MSTTMRHKAAVSAVLLLVSVLAGGALYGEDVEDVVRKQALVIREYDILKELVLKPAGVAQEFEVFTLKNPDFYRNSYGRSRTAYTIRELLRGKPTWLAVFDQCGLSEPGEYVCRKPECVLHGRLFRNEQNNRSLPRYGGFVYLYSICAVAGGILLFTLVAAGGRYICARLESR